MGEVMEAIMAAAVLGAEVAVAAVPGAVAAADLAAEVHPDHGKVIALA